MKRHRRQFTLIEMLIAAALMLIVFRVVAVVYSQTTKISRNAMDKADIYAELRAVLDFVTDDFRGYYPTAIEMNPSAVDCDSQDAGTTFPYEITFPSLNLSTFVEADGGDEADSEGNIGFLIPMGKVTYKVVERDIGGDKKFYDLYRKADAYDGADDHLDDVSSSEDFLLVDNLDSITITEVEEDELIKIELSKGDWRAIEQGENPFFKAVTVTKYAFLSQIEVPP